MQKFGAFRFLAVGGLAILLLLTLSATALAASAGYNVSVLTNQPTNKVIVFARGSNGGLHKAGSYLTGGKGTGTALGSLGSLKLSANGRWLFAVNPASDTISVFAVNGHKLHRTDVEPCGGSHPVSLAYHEMKLYVLNTGGTGNLTGFRLRWKTGKLDPISGSTFPLSNDQEGTSPQGVKISFCSAGLVLVVTEKDTGKVMAYRMYGPRPIGRKIYDSPGATPTGFDFNPTGAVIVAEGQDGVEGVSSASSYMMHCGDILNLVTSSLGDGGTAAAGVVNYPGGAYAYVSNSASGSISRYQVMADGGLVLRAGVAGMTGLGSKPDGMVFSIDGRQLYALCRGTDTVCGFHYGSKGTLSKFRTAVWIPGDSSGIAAW
jgi:6-phosphogluconolactonase